MAENLNCSIDTIRRNMRKEDSGFCNAYKKGYSKLKLKLSEAQVKCAIEKSNPALLIWLGKQHLDQKDDRFEPPKDITPITVNIVRDND